MVKLAAAISKWRGQGKRVALAVVVRTADSSPRPLGSMMAISDAGDIEGSVSAGCSEGVMVREALALLESGSSEPVLIELTDTAEAFAVAAPCGGALSVLISPFDDEIHGEMLSCMKSGEEFALVAAFGCDGPLAQAIAVVSRDRRTAVWMDDAALAEALDRVGWDWGGHPKKSPYEGDVSNPAAQFAGARAGVFDIMGQSLFACRYDAHPRLVCVGAVHISACLAVMAQTAGYAVTIVDPRAAFLLPERFPDGVELVHAWPQQVLSEMGISNSTAVCVLTHDAKIDEPALEASLGTDAFYIGCLGSAKTLRVRVAHLLECGVTPEALRRVHGPIGLYIGGRTPGDIAVSTLAQIQAVRYGRISYGEEMPGHTLDAFLDERAR